jgi:hypothetical protein
LADWWIRWLVGWLNGSALAKAWEIMRQSVKAIGDRHSQISESVAQQVQIPLSNFISNSEKETKDLIHHAKDKTGTLRSSRETLRKVWID